MTNAVAGGANSIVSKSPAAGSNAGAVDAQAHPIWKRDEAGANVVDNDGKPVLKSGTGPRPGRLDRMPIASRTTNETSGPGVEESPDARRQHGRIGGAALLAVRQEIVGNKYRAIFHPKRSAVLAGVGFLENLFRGKR